MRTINQTNKQQQNRSKQKEAIPKNTNKTNTKQNKANKTEQTKQNKAN